MKNLKLVVNKMHIRFEDDYFSNGETKYWLPFSFGFVVDRFEVSSSDSEWLFESPLSLNIGRNRPKKEHWYVRWYNDIAMPREMEQDHL